jgi:hypothetical protein
MQRYDVFRLYHAFNLKNFRELKFISNIPILSCYSDNYSSRGCVRPERFENRMWHLAESFGGAAGGKPGLRLFRSAGGD